MPKIWALCQEKKEQKEEQQVLVLADWQLGERGLDVRLRANSARGLLALPAATCQAGSRVSQAG
jgi:hypothetical protein